MADLGRFSHWEPQKFSPFPPLYKKRIFHQIPTGGGKPAFSLTALLSWFTIRGNFDPARRVPASLPPSTTIQDVYKRQVLAILGNPRTGTDNLLMGWWFWVFDNEQRLPAILQCFFFPPELPSSPNFFPDHGAKWSSTAAWLPMVSMTGVIAYLCSVKKSWIKRILLLSLFMAVIPGLNSAFIPVSYTHLQCCWAPPKSWPRSRRS